MAGPSLPAQAPTEGRSARLCNVALDGYPEFADPAEQRRALKEFKALGGDTAALWRDLIWHDVGRDAARLRREAKAFWEHRRATWDEGELRKLLAKVRKLIADHQKLELNPSPEVVAWEATLARAVHRVSSEVARCDPGTLAQRRRRAATGTPRERLHHQIPALTKRASNVQAVRRYFMPEVIRVVYAHANRVKPAVEQREHRRYGERYGGRPGDKAERWRVQSEVLSALHGLTARLVRAFYPFWANGLTPRQVRYTIENMRKRRRAAR